MDHEQFCSVVQNLSSGSALVVDPVTQRVFAVATAGVMCLEQAHCLRVMEIALRAQRMAGGRGLSGG